MSAHMYDIKTPLIKFTLLYFQYLTVIIAPVWIKQLMPDLVKISIFIGFYRKRNVTSNV